MTEKKFQKSPFSVLVKADYANHVSGGTGSSEVATTGISDHHRSWGYEDGPWKGPEPPLLVAADF